MRYNINLVSLKLAKAHLAVDHDEDDFLIGEMRNMASQSVLDYLKLDTSATDFDWVDESGEPDDARLPPVVKSAVLLVLGAMYENRDGDLWRSPQPLSQAVIDLLMRQRDPAMSVPDASTFPFGRCW